MVNRERFAELAEQVSKSSRERCQFPSVIDEEFKELVSKHKQDEEFGFHCRHIMSSIERLEKAEREYVDALSVFSDRANWLPDFLRR